MTTGVWTRDFHEDFDAEDSEFNDHYDAVVADLLAHCPVPRSKKYGGYVVVCDYATMRQLSLEPETVSNSFDGILLHPMGDRVRMIPVELDGEQHREWRRILANFFTSSYAARQEPLMREICREFIDTFAAAGQCDLVADFTGHLPTTVFLRSVLGMPAEDAKWLRKTLHGFLTGTEEERAAAYGEFTEYVLRHLDLRRKSPSQGGDLIDTVLAAEINGAPISPDDQLSCVLTMVAAAIDATSSFLAAGVYHFATHPEHAATALASSDGMHCAVEEILRVYAPSWMNVKRVTSDVEIGGRQLRRGDIVALSPAAACRDPRKFPDPERGHLGDALPPHASFGFGPHHCPGAPLARDLGRIVFQEVLTELPDLRVTAEPTFTTHYLRSWTSLPVTFTPRKTGTGRP